MFTLASLLSNFIMDTKLLSLLLNKSTSSSFQILRVCDVQVWSICSLIVEGKTQMRVGLIDLRFLRIYTIQFGAHTHH